MVIGTIIFYSHICNVKYTGWIIISDEHGYSSRHSFGLFLCPNL